MKFFRAFILIVPIAIIAYSQDKQPAEKATAVAGTKVSMQPPAEFTPSSQFPGFEYEALGSSIIITEFPGPFKEISAGVSDPAVLKKRDISVLSRQQVKVDGQSGLLVQVAQNAFGTDYIKWLLIFGDEKESVMIAATFPKEYENKLSEKMKTSILSATWERGKDLAFTINEKGDLKLARRFSNMLAFTSGGVIPKASSDDPLFVVGQSNSRIEFSNPEGYARSRIYTTEGVNGVEIEQINKMTIDNMNGYEIVARGKDLKSGQPVVIYQALLFEGQSYYIMTGLISDKRKQEYLTVFKEMAGTFKRD